MKKQLFSKIKTKSEARQYAIDWQHWQSTRRLSRLQMATYNERFYILGKKYGLLREFKREGII